MEGIFLGVNISIFILTIIAFLIFSRRQQQMFILAAIYAVLFENMNMLLSRGQIAGYSYNREFIWFIFDTPLFVILAWALLITTSYYVLTQKEGTNNSIWLVLKAAILVLLIDLSIDVFAIRLDFWRWNGYSFNEGFWGVPAINYIGWFTVTFIFLMIYNYLQDKKFIWLIPFLSYPLVLLVIGLYKHLILFFNLNKQEEVLIFLIAFFVIYLGFLFQGNKKVILTKYGKILKFTLVTRLLFHLFSLVAIVLLKITYWPLLLIFILFFLLDSLMFRSSGKNHLI